MSRSAAPSKAGTLSCRLESGQISDDNQRIDRQKLEAGRCATGAAELTLGPSYLAVVAVALARRERLLHGSEGMLSLLACATIDALKARPRVTHARGDADRALREGRKPHL